MAENIPIRDESNYPNRPVTGGARSTWSLERLLRVSWGAIFVGFVVAFATQVLLLLLGAAIGLTVFEPGQAGEAWGWGVGLWWIISTIISLFVGGMVAGRLAGVPRSVDSMLHGVATWALIIFASLLLSGAAMGGVFNLASGLASGAGSAVGQQDGIQAQMTQMQQQQQQRQQQAEQQQQQVAQEIRQDAQQLVPQASPQLQQQLDQFVSDLQTGDEDKDQLVDAMTQEGIAEDQAEQVVDRWVQRYEQTQPGIFDQRTAEEATTAGAGVAWVTFIATLLGALAAMGGGWLGTPEDVNDLREGTHRSRSGETRTPPTGA